MQLCRCPSRAATPLWWPAARIIIGLLAAVLLAGYWLAAGWLLAYVALAGCLGSAA
jgi:hypothetical protein